MSDLRVDVKIETSPGLVRVATDTIARLKGWGKPIPEVLQFLMNTGHIKEPPALIEQPKPVAAGTELCMNCGDIYRMSRRRDGKPRCTRCGTLATPIAL
jgi:hypothetical protein